MGFTWTALLPTVPGKDIWGSALNAMLTEIRNACDTVAAQVDQIANRLPATIDRQVLDAPAPSLSATNAFTGYISGTDTRNGSWTVTSSLSPSGRRCIYLRVTTAATTAYARSYFDLVNSESRALDLVTRVGPGPFDGNSSTYQAFYGLQWRGTGWLPAAGTNPETIDGAIGLGIGSADTHWQITCYNGTTAHKISTGIPRGTADFSQEFIVRVHLPAAKTSVTVTVTEVASATTFSTTFTSDLPSAIADGSTTAKFVLYAGGNNVSCRPAVTHHATHIEVG